MAHVKIFLGKHSPFFVSALVHLGLLFALSCLVVAPDAERATTLLGAWDEAEEEVVRGIEIEQVAIEFVEEDLPAQTEVSVSVTEVPSVEPELPTYSPAAAEGTGPALGRPASHSQGRAGRKLVQNSERGGNRRGERDSVRFFGSKVYGQRVVFVLDKSGSMTARMRSNMRLQVLKREIIRSIHALDEGMMFNVIFFSRDYIEIDSRGLRPATRENKLKIIEWIRRMKFDGDTFPEEALKAAIEQRPDAIFFLTDGSFQPQVVETITAENAQFNIPIYTVGLGDPQGAALLRSLAARNQGMFRFIP